jgi:pyridoxamine 5'-phosphate oxidase
MVTFLNNNNEEPYKKFRKKYNDALLSNQEFIEAIAISSYSKKSQEVDSRFVNLKFVNSKEFIFFSNYDSPKSTQFNSHNQISAVIFWNKTNVQIRIKANIIKVATDYSSNYFKKRSIYKNALSISSNQSKEISSYEDVISNYQKALDEQKLNICPTYWGGYSFIPYYFEFWEGNDKRINKREAYSLHKNIWNKTFLQP